MLPEIKKVKPLEIFTPTVWQTVILRNYGIVPTEKIAKVLKTEEKVIEFEAKRMGLDGIAFNEGWEKRGYITIIRNNWHLLCYEQLIDLLGWDENKLDFTLKEDDFLSVKLGNFKPYCENVSYAPLTDDEIIKTQKIKDIIRRNFIKDYARPFEFYDGETVGDADNSGAFDKIVYGYSMLYGDTLLDGGEIISDEQLKTYKSVGVNGIWLQGVLSKLSPYPFIDGVSDGYQIRRKNLNTLIARCRKYGIGIYLYLNEPRALPENAFNERTEKLKGREYQGEYTLCTGRQEVKDYLYDAVYDFNKAVKDLEGIITITMSENLTNCYARPDNDCPICSKRKIYEVVPEVNNIIFRALSDAKSKTRLIANLWGWNKDFGWTDDDVIKGIDQLDKGIEILSVSEFGTVIKDGKPYYVGEYSISNVGPCEETKAKLSYAKKTGRKTLAKVQVNNSWEFPVIPYIPVFKLVEKHLLNLKQLGIEGLMESWTLGGYPSASLSLASKIFSGNYDYDEWLTENFGNNGDKVKNATELFSDAFGDFPFSMETLYFGGQAQGATNLWYKEKTGYKSTMVCYPYDDIEGWCGDFSLNEYTTKLTSLRDKWQKGLEIINGINGGVSFEDFKRYANVFYINVSSVINGVKYNLSRSGKDKNKIRECILLEEELTKKSYALSSQDCRIGYEASNHYYFTQNTFLEKLVNLENLKTDFEIGKTE